MSIELHKVDPESIMKQCYNYYMSHKKAYDIHGYAYSHSLEMSYKLKYDKMIALKESGNLTIENLANIVHRGWLYNTCDICTLELREPMIIIDGGEDTTVTICKGCSVKVTKLAEQIPYPNIN